MGGWSPIEKFRTSGTECSLGTPDQVAFDFDSDVGPFPNFKRGKIGKATTSVVPQGEEIRPYYHENKERHDTYTAAPDDL
jgi:hypothetical protein